MNALNIIKILSIPKSLYVCLRLFPIRQGIRLPLLIRYNTVLKRLNGKIVLAKKNIRLGTIQIGFEENNISDGKTDRCILDIAGTIIFDGNAVLGKGTRMSIHENGTLHLGNNFYNSAKITFICFHNIKFGNNCVTSWDTLIMDSDLHTTRDTVTGFVNESSGNVEIGDGVWIAARVTILKNTKIGNGCLVGANALITNVFDIENVLIAGVPASIRKRNITLNATIAR